MYNNFIELFYSKRNLINILVEITNVCNMRCVHCYQENRNSFRVNKIFLSYQIIEKMLDDLAGSSVINITLTGGEVFSHPDIEKIIMSISERNFNVNLLTNCTQINESNISLIKKYVNHISASCYGKSEDTYENVTGIKGSFEKYTTAISLLKNNNIRYNEKAVILKNNYSNMNDLIFSTKNSECRMIVDMNNSYCSKFVLDNIQVKEFYQQYYSHNKKELHSFMNRTVPFVCKMWYNSLFINRFGEISPCLNMYDSDFQFGNIYHDNIWNIWNSPQAMEKVKELTKKIHNNKCFSCEYGMYQQICPANNFYETGDLVSPSKYECEHCKIKSQVIKEMLKGTNYNE